MLTHITPQIQTMSFAMTTLKLPTSSHNVHHQSTQYNNNFTYIHSTQLHHNPCLDINTPRSTSADSTDLYCTPSNHDYNHPAI